MKPIFPQPTLTNIVEQSPCALKPWPGHARTHSARQLAQIKLNIGTYGFVIPVIVDESGTILAGHGRVQAAVEMKLPHIPTRVMAGLTQAAKRAFVLSDNKLTLLSSWDNELLVKEIQLLIDEDFELDLTGFNTVEIDVMIESADANVELQPTDVAEEVVSRQGDLWELDGHRLFCGDALVEVSYSALLGQDKAQMVITDPPYNVKVDGHAGGLGKVKHKEFAMASGEMSSEAFVGFLRSACKHLHTFMSAGAICFVFMDWRHQRELLDAAFPAFGPPKQMCVWVKDNAGMGSFYRSQHELVFAFKNGSAPHINNFELGQRGRYRTNVWEYPGINSGHGRKLLKLHPTVKPAAMIADAIRDCSHRDGLVLDPFAGSGTVLVAAERTGRRARAIELDPQYVDVGIRRWQRLTGKKAVLAATGQTWDQVRTERLAVPAMQLIAEANDGL